MDTVCMYLFNTGVQVVSKIHGINSRMNSSHVDNQNTLYQHRSGNA
jgi:hypothetical protein